MNEILITVFTPSFNRASLLPRLYDSLLKQTTGQFEWVIVDDGSTDETARVVNSMISENKLPIIFHTKVNEGKHLAINKGVELANGNLFFIVDSDDFLTEDAIDLILKSYPSVIDNPELAGISFRRGTSETEFIGTQDTFSDFTANYNDFRYRLGYTGDMAEVYKTEILRRNPFPKFEGEKFCPESLVWQRISTKYQMLWTSKIIYICEYQAGGLSDRIFEIRKKSPIATTLCYSELAKASVPFSIKVRAAINYWRFAKFLKGYTFYQKWKAIPGYLSILGLPLSKIFLIKDK